MRLVEGGVWIVAGTVGLVVVINAYRFALRVLRDPDTEKLLDGE